VFLFFSIISMDGWWWRSDKKKVQGLGGQGVTTGF